MHPEATVESALALAAAGVEATEIGRRLGVPKSTVQYWCRGGRRRLRRPERPSCCARCDGEPLDEAQYAYLLGSYLGDGHVVTGDGRTTVLTISCADDWPGVHAEVVRALEVVMRCSPVHSRPRTGCHAVSSYSKHWLCLLPQHGPRAKHTRPIVLEPWQVAIVERHPGSLLRGLFHSDGCRVTNWVPKRSGSGKERYEYPRYLFSNKSEDILRICEAALDRVGADHRRSRWDIVSVARRAAVAQLDEFVGPKT